MKTAVFFTGARQLAIKEKPKWIFQCEMGDCKASEGKVNAEDVESCEADAFFSCPSCSQYQMAKVQKQEFGFKHSGEKEKFNKQGHVPPSRRVHA